MDAVKQVLSVVLLVAGVAAFYYFSEVSLLYRVLALVAVVVLALVLLLATDPGDRIRAFLLGANQEVRKVVWPSRQETLQTTLVIFAVLIIFGLFLWVLDTILFWLVRWFTGQGG